MERKVKLTDFVKALEGAGLLEAADGANESVVSSVTYNSKEAGEGTLFVCKGAHFKAKYLQDAIDAGAAGYVTATEYGLGSEGCPEILVSDIRVAMPVIAETFYGRLSDELTMVGITGTKGKSTTAYFMRYILDDYMAATGGKRTAICSGIDNYDGVIEEESHLTTPEIMELYQHMNNALSTGIKYLTMEVSSQALKYDRVDGITFSAGAFLNIGSDHISAIEHPDFNDYLESKLRLFGHCRSLLRLFFHDHVQALFRRGSFFYHRKTALGTEIRQGWYLFAAMRANFLVIAHILPPSQDENAAS